MISQLPVFFHDAKDEVEENEETEKNAETCVVKHQFYISKNIDEIIKESNKLNCIRIYWG